MKSMKKLLFVLLSLSLLLGFSSCSDDEEKDNYTMSFTLGGKLTGTVSDIYHLYVEYTLETPQGTETKTVDVTSGYDDLELNNIPTPCTLTYRHFLKKLDGKTPDQYEFYNMTRRISRNYTLFKNGEKVYNSPLPSSLHYDSILGFDMDEILSGVNNVSGVYYMIIVNAEGHVTEATKP